MVSRQVSRLRNRLYKTTESAVHSGRPHRKEVCLKLLCCLVRTNSQVIRSKDVRSEKWFSLSRIKISVWRTIHDFHVLRLIFKIIYELKCFHRNYFFPLIASALTTVPVSYTHLHWNPWKQNTTPQIS